MKEHHSGNNETPFNPLDKRNLGVSVADAMLDKPVFPLPPANTFNGAGIYAIYYTGDFPAYRAIADANSKDRFSKPIYVGKAVPAGSRKGGLGLDAPSGISLHKRLREHAQSIEQADNLNIDDFFCRYLIVDDIWIPLGESLLIEMFSPVWNMALDGFGNHNTGKGRFEQQKSPWDIVHPGRPWAKLLRPHGKSVETLLAKVDEFVQR